MAIVSAAILSRYFDKAEYGTYRQITYVYSSLVVLFSAGLPNIFSYFLPRLGQQEGKELVQRITKMLLLFGIVFGIFLYLGAPFIARFMGNIEMVSGLRKFSIVPVLLLPTMGLDGIFASVQKTHLLAIFSTLNRLVMLICIVLPVILIENSSNMAINGWILASIISFLMSLWFKNLPYKGTSSLKSTIKNKDLFAYSIPLVTASLYGLLIRYADQFYISNYFGPEVYAEFSNGFIEIPLASVLTGSISIVLTPLFAKNSLTHDGINETFHIWKGVLIKSAVILYPIVVFLSIFGKEIMVFIYSKNYEQSGLYFQINTILNFFNIITFTPILYAYGRVRFYSNLHLFFAVVAWVFGYFIIVLFNNPIAIAVLSTLIQISFVVISIIVVSDILKVKLIDILPVAKLFKIISSCLVAAYVTRLIGQALVENQYSLLFLFFCGSLYFSVLIIIWKIIKIEWLYIYVPIVQKLKNKFS
ncbi:MAG: oligosaccharide flippase family protein [Saprospiraceae bacterium]|nr:oligosaccharide flippase family protein [Saprospiraceae bacterium]